MSVHPDQFFLEMLQTYVASDSCFPFRVCVIISMVCVYVGDTVNLQFTVSPVFVHIVGPNLFDHKKDDRFVRITLFTVI